MDKFKQILFDQALFIFVGKQLVATSPGKDLLRGTHLAYHGSPEEVLPWASMVSQLSLNPFRLISEMGHAALLSDNWSSHGFILLSQHPRGKASYGALGHHATVGNGES